LYIKNPVAASYHAQVIKSRLSKKSKKVHWYLLDCAEKTILTVQPYKRGQSKWDIESYLWEYAEVEIYHLAKEDLDATQIGNLLPMYTNRMNFAYDEEERA
jgi:hypothetical protein